LRIDASPLRGNAPLNVIFTSDRIGNPELLRWDFNDGTLFHSMNAAHTFLKAGQYLVRAETMSNNQSIVSFLPLVVLPNLSLKA
jgi:PKD repeat protein